MNDGLHNDSDDIPEHILKQAAIWQARLSEVDDKSGAGRELKAEFNRWLLANPRHRQAMAEMDTLWAALEQPVVRALAEASSNPAAQPVAVAPARSRITTRSIHSHMFQRYAIVACLPLVMVSGIGWQQDWITHWQSDYITAVGEQAPVALDDGTTITLNTRSAIAVDYTGAARRVRLLMGEAWFDVSDDPQRPFTVATERGEVRVTGTQFNVRQTAEAAIVSLDQGRVELHSDDRQQQALALMPGQQARLTATGISTPNDFDRTAVTAWLRGQLVFYDSPLGKVVDTLNRYRQGRILITSDELNRLRVSGVFSTTDPDAALALITDTLPVQQTRLTDYLVLLR